MSKKNSDNGEKDLVIKININDYRDDTMRKEIEIKSKDDIIEALTKDGHSTADVARATLVARELELAPENIIRPNKVLVTVSAMQDVSRIAHHNSRKVVHTPKGDHFVPTIVARAASFPVEISAEEDEVEQEEQEKRTIDDGPSFVPYLGENSVSRTYDYFNRIIPGHIKERLVTLYANGEDVRKAADDLKAMIDRLVDEII